MDPWTIKYHPKTTEGVKGQPSALQKLKDLVKLKKAALLYGPPGTGKTSSVIALANELGHELIEVNASDNRNKEDILSKVGAAVFQTSLFATSKIILVDEIDGISGTMDKGGITVLCDLIKKSRYPIVMTANDPWDQRFSDLRRHSELVEFHSLNYVSIKSHLKSICETEGIEYDDNALTTLARYANGDMRAAITDLQVIGKRLTKKDLEDIYDRERTQSMVDALMKIFKSKSPDIFLDALENVDEEIGQMFFWIDENLPREYTKIADLARAYDNMSLADRFHARIIRWQYWRYLAYVKLLLTAGVSLAKEDKYPGFNRYVRTTRILKMWQANNANNQRKVITKKIADATHTSYRRALHDTFPYLSIAMQKDKGMAAELDISPEEMEYLKKG